MAFRPHRKKVNTGFVNHEKNVKLELHERLDEGHLTNINEKFNAAEGKCMNDKELRNLLATTANINFEDNELQIIFKQMDKKCNGLVTWDDFISYLIIGFEQKEVSLEYKSLLPPIPSTPRMIKSNHRHPVNRVAFYPCVRLDRTVSEHAGSILTCSKDGVINFWSMHMQLERTAQSTCPELKIQPTWVTDMVILPDVSVICTSSTERDLRFYDTSARKFELRVMMTSLEYAISTMCYAFSQNVEEESKLFLGGMGGSIIVIFIQTAARGPFKSKPGDPLLTVRFDRVFRGFVQGFRVVEFKNLHTDFVRQLRYYKSLNCIISCAQCPKAALLITDITQAKDSYVFRVLTGIWCFSLEESSHLIATSGPDCLIRIWNPFVPTRPTSVLYGHHTGVVQMTFQDSGKILYTLSKDKCIKVWDITGQHCLQSYFGLPVEMGERTALTALYVPEKRQWIIGSAMIALLPLSPQPNAEHTDGNTHSESISVVLYNKLFKVVVTCGLDSYIIVWNPWDGRRMMVIKEAHTKMLYGEKIPVEITAATFNPGENRLITAAHDGSLKIWDFNTGICIRNLQVDTKNEIKSVLWLKNRIFACGWNRCLTEFGDSGEAVASGGTNGKNWEQLHEEDISAAAVRAPQTLVTSSFSGELIFWRLETGQPYKKFMVYDPSVRIKIQYKARPKKRMDEDFTVFKHSIYSKQMSRSFSKFIMSRKKNKFYHEGSSEETYEHFKKIAVNCLLFLKTREMDADIGSLLVALGDGLIQVWSHHTAGGFITAFSAVHKIGDYVTSMATDEKNEFLFTGTINGYLKTWLMKNYCAPEKESICMPKYRLMFPFLWGDTFTGRAQRMVKNQPKPFLLNSYKGHLKPVTGLVYINEAEILISSSADFSARMWTLGGRFLQTVGTFKKWKPLSSNTPVTDSFEFTVPADLKRAVSSTTYRVLIGGTVLKKIRSDQNQLQALKKSLFIDKKKIYSKSLTEPILGNFYSIPKRTLKSSDIEFDTTFPYIPVYQHIIMPQRVDIKEQASADPKTSKEQKNVSENNKK